jgi:hypothetical protein
MKKKETTSDYEITEGQAKNMVEEKRSWTDVFHPDKDTKRLRYYSQFFNTAEMDSTFYDSSDYA